MCSQYLISSVKKVLLYTKKKRKQLRKINQHIYKKTYIISKKKKTYIYIYDNKQKKKHIYIYKMQKIIYITKKMTFKLKK